jgi:hypothetical protein
MLIHKAQVRLNTFFHIFNKVTKKAVLLNILGTHTLLKSWQLKLCELKSYLFPLQTLRQYTTKIRIPDISMFMIETNTFKSFVSKEKIVALRNVCSCIVLICSLKSIFFYFHPYWHSRKLNHTLLYKETLFTEESTKSLSLGF